MLRARYPMPDGGANGAVRVPGAGGATARRDMHGAVASTRPDPAPARRGPTGRDESVVQSGKSGS